MEDQIQSQEPVASSTVQIPVPTPESIPVPHEPATPAPEEFKEGSGQQTAPTPQTKPLPCLGTLLFYRLTAADAEKITAERKASAPIGDRHGNTPAEGQVYPMTVVRIFSGVVDDAVNGHVFLDGNDSLWVTSVHEGDGPGTWSWMPPHE